MACIATVFSFVPKYGMSVLRVRWRSQPLPPRVTAVATSVSGKPSCVYLQAASVLTSRGAHVAGAVGQGKLAKWRAAAAPLRAAADLGRHLGRHR